VVLEEGMEVGMGQCLEGKVCAKEGMLGMKEGMCECRARDDPAASSQSNALKCELGCPEASVVAKSVEPAAAAQGVVPSPAAQRAGKMGVKELSDALEVARGGNAKTVCVERPGAEIAFTIEGTRAPREMDRQVVGRGVQRESSRNRATCRRRGG